MHLIRLLSYFYISIQLESKWGYKELIYVIRACSDITTFFPLPAPYNNPFPPPKENTDFSEEEGAKGGRVEGKNLYMSFSCTHTYLNPLTFECGRNAGQQ